MDELVLETKVDKQLTGLSGEFFVAAELSKRNFQVALTLGNAKAVDIFAVDQENTDNKWEIEVKTLRKSPNCFDLPTKRLKDNAIYFFVYLNDIDVYPDFFILTGKELREKQEDFYGASLYKGRETVNHGPLQKHINAWHKLRKK